MTKNKSDYAVVQTLKSIHVTIKETGETYTVRNDDPRYEKLKACIESDRWHEVPQYLSNNKYFESNSEGKMRIMNGRVYVKTRDGRNWAVPSKLNATILEYISQELPFMPLVNFAINLSENPDQNAIFGLFEFIEKNKITITDNGCFIAYKGITRDWKDLRTRTIDNSIGARVKMKRKDVVADPSRTCSAGLHVASYDYAKGGYGGQRMIYVEVSPRDVCAVPREYSMAKIRCCEYLVLGEAAKNMETPYYSTVRDREKIAQSVEDNQRGAMPLRD